MTQNDWTGFKDLMNSTADYYRQKRLSEGAMRLMFQALKDMTLEVISMGVVKHMSGMDGNTARFCPNAADIRLALYGTPEHQAVMAWAAVQNAIRTLRYETSVRFNTPATHFAIETCGGWYGLCFSTTDKSQMFIKAYVAAIARGVAWKDVRDHFAGDRECRDSVLRPWEPDQIADVDVTRAQDPGKVVGSGNSVMGMLAG